MPRLADGEPEEHSAAVAQACRQHRESIGAELESVGLRSFGNAYAEISAYIAGYAMSRTRGEAA